LRAKPIKKKISSLQDFSLILCRSSGFIVTGETAKQGAYPFLAAVGVVDSRRTQEIIYICSGSLVSQLVTIN